MEDGGALGEALFAASALHPDVKLMLSLRLLGDSGTPLLEEECSPYAAPASVYRHQREVNGSVCGG